MARDDQEQPPVDGKPLDHSARTEPRLFEDVDSVAAQPDTGSGSTRWISGARSRTRGRPRPSTAVLTLAWIGLLVLYLAVRPGG